MYLRSPTSSPTSYETRSVPRSGPPTLWYHDDIGGLGGVHLIAGFSSRLSPPFAAHSLFSGGKQRPSL